jgi:hypothetical protein
VGTPLNAWSTRDLQVARAPFRMTRRPIHEINSLIADSG